MIRLLLALLLIVPSVSFASVTIDAQVIRNQTGSGSTFISSGFPVRPGDVTEAMITGGLIKVYVNEGSGLVEKQCNITGLRGRFADGSLRSILIQFQVDSMQQNNTANDYALPAQVVIDNGARSSADLTYHLVTWTDVTNNNVILATDKTYLVDTEVTFQKLLPTGQGSAAEQLLYDDMMEYRFDGLVATPNFGQAFYEHERGLIANFARTGDQKFQKQAIVVSQNALGLQYSTPLSTPYTALTAIVNPNGRATGSGSGEHSQQNGPRAGGYAALYLMTGFRDYWSTTAYLASLQKLNPAFGVITSQAALDDALPVPGAYDEFRQSYSFAYGNLIPAHAIDATLRVQRYGSPVLPEIAHETYLEWVLNSINTNKWDIRWLPYNNGTGTTPATDGVTLTITQGAISARVRGFFPRAKNDPRRYPGVTHPMQDTGWIMIDPPTGGSFTSGALTFSSGSQTASATGAEVGDYRNGMTGVRPYSLRAPSQVNYITVNITDDTGVPGTTGTLMTVLSMGDPYNILDVGENIRLDGVITPGTSISARISGTGTTGTYRVTIPHSVTNVTPSSSTLLPVFQVIFINNFLIDYYHNVKADSRIPGLVKSNIDAVLQNMVLMEAGDLHYNKTDVTYGTTGYGTPYQLENPPLRGGSSYELPEHARAIAFVLKTVSGAGSMTVNDFGGTPASYATWYTRTAYAGNINRNIFSSMEWKNWGQYWGFASDTTYLNNATTVTGPSTARTPTQWNAIPSATPDLARGVGGGGTKWKIKAITTDE